VSVRTPHFRTPFSVEGSSVAVVDEGTEVEVRQCVVAALNTKLGSLIDLPEFGIPFDVFKQQSPNPSADRYVAAVERCEPRANLLGSATVEDLAMRIAIAPEREEASNG